MSTPFKRLMATVKPHLPGAIDDNIRQELFLACHEFFRRSNVWREDIEFTLKAGKNTAYITPSAGKIERLMYVTGEGGYPVQGARMEGFDKIHMPYQGDGKARFTATVALLVSDPVTRDAYPIVPYDVVERYTEELIHGILARMMAQPSKPYTNMSLAQFYLTRFRAGISRAKVSKQIGNTFGSSNWTFPRNF